VSDRTVIIVSPYFPPSTLAGVHRARHLAKHLPAAGWTPIVLCVDETYHEQGLDPALAALVPGHVQIVKTAALPARLTHGLGFGDISLRAWWPLRRALVRLLKTQPVGAVLITGSPFYPMLLAPVIRRRFRVPVVLDFQDPWVSAWGAEQPGLSRAGLSYRLAKVLEPRALGGSDFVVSVSDTQNEEMASRYPWFDCSRMAGIPIGGDPDDFSDLRAAPAFEGENHLEPGFIHLSYIGTFLPRAGPLVRTLFRAFARLRAAEPALAARVRLNFIGTSNQPNDGLTFRVRPLAEAEGVADAVRETPRRLPYMHALGALARSDGVLLIGSDEPHYTASKIYPALMSGRPYLSLFHRASSAHAILIAAGGGRGFAFATPEELAALEAPLADGLRTLAAAPESLGRVDPSAYAPYEARAIASRFARIFDRFAAKGPPQLVRPHALATSHDPAIPPPNAAAPLDNVLAVTEAASC
jgi:Glycosyl transferase 4-like domain